MKRLLLVCFLFVAVMLCACRTVVIDEGYADENSIGIVDMLGRKVEVPSDIQRVACIGSGALRLYSYIGDMSKLCGVEACEYGHLISVRPYQLLNAELFASLPSVGAGGPQGAPDAEALLNCNPDIIFSLYTSDAGAMDELQSKTGIPVVVLSYGDTEAFDKAVLDSITLMGDILGRRERAAEVCGFISELTSDLDNRTKDIPDEQKPTVYIGCQTNYGIHGIGSSMADYSLFNAVNAKNVLDINGYKGYQKALDMEALCEMNPDIIILDAGGLSILKEEYNEKPEVFGLLDAFKNGNVYLQMPYNAYFTNLEIAYANAYFIGKTLYPDRFEDVDIAEKFDRITTALLGSPCYSLVADAMYGGYGKLDIQSLKNQ